MTHRVLLKSILATIIFTSTSVICQEYSLESITIHPPLKERFTSREHYKGEYKYVGDQLGRDFSIYINGRSYKNDGDKNSDFHVWEKDVLAPFDGEVALVYNQNKTVNIPGKFGKGRANSVFFKNSKGEMVLIGHLRNIIVKKGDKVKAGQKIAQVGNNGTSTGPHIHIGAWKDKTPLQIQIDLIALGKLRKKKK